MNFFKYMAKSLVESANGKIEIYSNGWVYGDQPVTNANGVILKPILSGDGKLMRIALNVRTAGNCPSPPSDYPRGQNLGHWVPMKVCRKCPYHRPRRRGQPYQCCDFLRDLRAKGPSPEEKMGSIMQAAVDRTNDLLKGGPT